MLMPRFGRHSMRTFCCPIAATDHPTVTVTVFRADSVYRVVDYRGCYAGPNLSAAPPVAALRHFGSEIDSVAQSQRWVRPGERRLPSR